MRTKKPAKKRPALVPLEEVRFGPSNASQRRKYAREAKLWPKPIATRSILRPS